MEEQLTADDLATQLSGNVETDQPEDQESQNDEAEQSAEQPAPEADEAEQSEPEAEEAQPEQPETESGVVELTVNGEKVQLTLEEVKNGYLRQADYTQKAQNLARERQEAQARIQQEFHQVQAMAGEYGQLTNIDSQLQQYQQVNWAALRESDPLAYTQHMAEMNNLRAVRGDLLAQIQGKQQYMQQLQQQTFAQQTQEAADYLKSVIPNFGQDTLKTMKTYGEKLGFSAQELAEVADKRMLQVLWEASQWRTLQDKKPALQNKVKALPTKATKAAAPAVPAKQAQLDKQQRRLAQTGKVSDFASLLNSL